jgi:two-component system nitrogen regulation response regulator GlnG
MGHVVEAASSAEEGLELAAASRFDLLILDVRLPGMDGLTAMEAFGSYLAGAPIIVITAFGDLATAVNSIEKGAFEYVVKPFDVAEIRAAIERALRVETAPAMSAPPSALDSMLGHTPAMQNVFKRSRWRRILMRRCCCRAKAASARRWPPRLSIVIASGGTGRWWR